MAQDLVAVVPELATEPLQEAQEALALVVAAEPAAILTQEISSGEEEPEDQV